MIFDFRPCELGEGPLWHPGEKRLYGVDIERRMIWRVDPIDGRSEQYALPVQVGCLGLRVQDDFVLAFQLCENTNNPRVENKSA